MVLSGVDSNTHNIDMVLSVVDSNTHNIDMVLSGVDSDTRCNIDTPPGCYQG